MVLLSACFFLLLPGPEAHAQDKPVFGSWGVDLSAMDRSTRPGDNFHRYANGGWLDAATIPEDADSAGLVQDLERRADDKVRAILEGEGRLDPLAGQEDLAKARMLYRSLQDRASMDQRGLDPVRPSLEAIRRAQTREDLVVLMGGASRGRAANLFAVRVDIDDLDPDAYVLKIGQAGLGLTDRSVYLEPQHAVRFQAYQAYVERLLALAAWPESEAAAAGVVALETRFAEATWPRSRMRAPEDMYSPRTLAELQQKAPGFPWRAYLAASGLANTDRVVLGPEPAVIRLAEIFSETPVDTLKAWFAFHRLDAAAPFLSEPFANEHFAFRRRILLGWKAEPPPWRTAVDAVNLSMGEAVGRAYVARHFPDQSRRDVQAIVKDLKAAMRARLQRLDWMSAGTRKEAIRKLDRLNVKIGYPDVWRDYSGLEIRPAEAVENLDRAAAFEWRSQLQRLGAPVDRNRWAMTPQTVNAYAASRLNEIVFPAALLQPPLFDPNADPAVNYGAIGFIIGHEIIHGFDDRGRKFDASGQLRDWWTAEDSKRFEAEAARLGAQYAAMPTQSGGRIDAGLTMGENIADLGGLELALEAWRRSPKRGPARSSRDGFSPTQRVLLGWAQIWRMKRTDSAESERLRSESHAPPYARGNIPAANLDAFHDHFDVRPGNLMYLAPEDRVRLW
jgi:putative endopeptidase